MESPRTDHRSITVIVPAHNEEAGLPATLESLARQTVPPTEVIVVDDASDDRTGETAAAHGATVLRPPQNQGSKAKAQNYALPYCATELVLAVDADTVLAPDYIELTIAAFDDPRVVIAAGNVQTRFTRTVWERGRSVEYLFGFHWHRPIQHRAGSPMVCSGCCSVFRREDLVAFGGFPERTIVEDMDYCVPLDHRMLTRDGFKRHDELAVGEDVLTLDHERGTLEWTPLEEVCVFDYDGELYRLERGGDWSVEFTPNHRWPVITSTGDRTMLAARDMGLDDGERLGYRLPLNGRYNASGDVSPRLAAAIGRMVAVGDHQGVARYMRGEADLPTFVGRLSTAAAQAMFSALHATDSETLTGSKKPADSKPPTEPTTPVREAIQMLSLMAGANTCARPRPRPRPNAPDPDPPTQPTQPTQQTGETLDPTVGLSKLHHSGKVWCPRTKHGTWIVEHDGAVIPTGNTWSQQIQGKRAVYVSDAVAWAADPESLTYLRKQVWRWMAGFCQNVRIHLPRLFTAKPILALWVLLAVFEILAAPLWWATPFILAATTAHSLTTAAAWWVGAELLLTAPPLIYAARRRKLPITRVLLNIPCVYATKVVNLVYAWKALIVELILVPLRLAKGLTVYEKGRPAIPTTP